MREHLDHPAQHLEVPGLALADVKHLLPASRRFPFRLLKSLPIVESTSWRPRVWLIRWPSTLGLINCRVPIMLHLWCDSGTGDGAYGKDPRHRGGDYSSSRCRMSFVRLVQNWGCPIRKMRQPLLGDQEKYFANWLCKLE